MKNGLFFLMLCLLSCKSSTEGPVSARSQLYYDVMDIHDKVMPQLSTIHKLKRELKKLSTEKTHQRVLQQLLQLEKADEAMMSWMEKFIGSGDSTVSDKYLMGEKIKIQIVSEAMYKSISDAQMLIDSLSGANK